MKLGKWFRIRYNKIAESIAFYPALIAVGFLLLSWGMLEIDFSTWGTHMKSGLSWLSLKDASTARSIISTVAGAIISLTVFSFSMVMIVLNQAASQMSNRVLTSMIENRFQQVILGFYIGTIVYALFLLSTIRDINSGVYVPALSIYLLIVLTVIDIFLFIYFLDYVTQTVKYETVIHRVQEQTMSTMKKKFAEIRDETAHWKGLPCVELFAGESNYFQDINERNLMKIANEKNLYISFIYKQGTYLIKGSLFMLIYCKEKIDDKCLKEILSATDFYQGQPIDRNADYGFNQLAEVAIKALSPGINDPATAVISLHSLSDLFAYRLYHSLPHLICDNENEERIYLPSSSFGDVFEKCIHPIWNYGKEDQYIQDEIIFMVQQLKKADYKKMYTDVFDKLLDKVNKERLQTIA
ncbi:MAG: DUF2254 domain-containing protein [Bacteroidota bacterium]|nr:DUF2254 domain-containing protein [Bacteroidota bacterium]